MLNQKTDLLILQPTTFCNLDCSYCYLPNRDNHRLMELGTLRATLENLRESQLLGPSLSVVWHAGEPLVAPLSFYEQAFAEIEQWAGDDLVVRQSIQTNGTLIEEAHARLFRRYNVSIGLSLDGPAFIHDAQRATRSGRPSFDRVMRGLAVLKQHEVVFNVITVLTSKSLDYPDEIYEFFAEQGVPQVGFNIDEIEGINISSSFQNGDSWQRYRSFMRRLYQLSQAEGKFTIREIQGLELLIRSGRELETNNQVEPLAILTVGVTGDYGTFSPELLESQHEDYESFHIGNVHDGLIRHAVSDSRVTALFEDVAAGVDMCRRECRYFGLCGGGAPSNKLFENGSFRTSETLFCRLTKQVLSDVLLECIEEQLELESA